MKYEYTAKCTTSEIGVAEVTNSEGGIRLQSISNTLKLHKGAAYKITVERV